jgi:hypothetical protein
MISGQSSTSVTKKWMSTVHQATRVVGCISVVFFLHGAACADEIWDAKKPGATTSTIDANDNSCWMASAANMMAADGWGTAQTVYDTLRGDYNNNSNAWKNGGLQTDAINWVNNHPGTYGITPAHADGKADSDEIIFDDGRQYTGTTHDTAAIPNARAEIHGLLNTKTANDLPSDVLGEGPDDPVGIGIYALGDIPATGKNEEGTGYVFAHAVTVWGEDSSLGLQVTDSDQSGGIFSLPWADNGTSTTDVMYPGYGQVFVGYLSFMADSPVPEPTAVVAFVSMCGMGLIGLSWRRVKWS